MSLNKEVAGILHGIWSVYFTYYYKTDSVSEMSKSRPRGRRKQDQIKIRMMIWCLVSSSHNLILSIYFIVYKFIRPTRLYESGAYIWYYAYGRLSLSITWKPVLRGYPVGKRDVRYSTFLTCSDFDRASIFSNSLFYVNCYREVGLQLSRRVPFVILNWDATSVRNGRDNST